MATTPDFIEYVCEQLAGAGVIRYRKMFGEYCVYINDKPILLVCDNMVYVKMLEQLAEKMGDDAPTDKPYPGAKEHYVLDIDDGDFSREVAVIAERATPLPKPKKKKIKEV